MWTDVVVALISSITTIAAIYVTNRLKIKKRDTVTHRIQRDVVVYEIMNALREKFKFSRVIVALFHNGSKYFNGEPIQRFSIAFETTSPGVDPATKSMQDIPVSTMHYSLKYLANDGQFIIHDMSKCPDEHYRNLMLSYKETKHYSFKIDDAAGWIGVLLCDYTTENDHPILSDSCTEYIKVQAGRLSTLLKLTNKPYGLPN